MTDYLTLEELKAFNNGKWDELHTVFALLKISSASALVRQLFRERNLTVEQRIIDGKLEEALLKEVVASMVLRTLPDDTDVNYEQKSESITGIGSIQITPFKRDRNLFITRSEKFEKLGLPVMGIGYLP